MSLIMPLVFYKFSSMRFYCDSLNRICRRKQKKVKDQGSSVSELPYGKKMKPMVSTRKAFGNRDQQDVQFIQLEDGEGSEGGDRDEEDYNIQITLLDPFTKLLELDYFYIHEESKVIHKLFCLMLHLFLNRNWQLWCIFQLPTLPAPISVVQILEKFVKFNALRKLERWYKKYHWGLVASRTANSIGKPTSANPYAKASQPQPIASSEVKTPDELVKILHEVDIMKQLATGKLVPSLLHLSDRIKYAKFNNYRHDTNV